MNRARYKNITSEKAAVAREILVKSAKTNLQVMRLSAGLSLSQLAYRVGTSYSLLSAYENGKRELCRMSDDLASRIAAVLRCSVDDVRAPVDAPQPPINLRNLRLAAGITQAELSKQIGISQSAISAYERGFLPLSSMSEQLAERIAAALHCTPADIKEE